MRTLCIWHLQYLQSFRNGSLFCTYWLIRNLNCADSHHARYGERCSNHHFRHCAQCVSEIYSVLKLFEIAVSFAHFGIFEISTPVRRIMLTIPNIVQISRFKLCLLCFQHCAHCVYDIYSICKVFEMAVCFAHIVVFVIWTPLAMVNVVQIIISNIAHSVYMRFTVFSKFSKLLFVLHIMADSKFLLRSWATC